MDCDQSKRILRAIRVFEDRLTGHVTVSEAAEAACYSLYHFCRTFNTVAHHSPYDYLMRRRLSEAAQRLIGAESDSRRPRIIDIAFDYRFNSAESFSRAFKKMFGVQPKQYRNRGTIDRRYLLDEITAHHLDLMNRAAGPIPERIQLDGMTVTGLMRFVSRECAGIDRLWEDLGTGPRTKIAQHSSSQGVSPYIGIACFPREWKRSGLYYLAGVRRQEHETENPALIAKQLAAGMYARFSFAAKHDELQHILEYILQTWLQKSGYRREVPFVLIAYDSRPEPGGKAVIGQQVCVPLL